MEIQEAMGSMGGVCVTFDEVPVEAEDDEGERSQEHSQMYSTHKGKENTQ